MGKENDGNTVLINGALKILKNLKYFFKKDLLKCCMIQISLNNSSLLVLHVTYLILPEVVHAVI